MERLVEVYRGVAIERTAEVIGFNPGARDAFCFSIRERAEDSAPIIDMFPTVEAAREAIDDEFYDLETFEIEFQAAPVEGDA